eukprot:39161-Eustigmatos_ZCMA.PRE.1
MDVNGYSIGFASMKLDSSCTRSSKKQMHSSGDSGLPWKAPRPIGITTPKMVVSLPMSNRRMISTHWR